MVMVYVQRYYGSQQLFGRRFLMSRFSFVQPAKPESSYIESADKSFRHYFEQHGSMVYVVGAQPPSDPSLKIPEFALLSQPNEKAVEAAVHVRCNLHSVFEFRTRY